MQNSNFKQPSALWQVYSFDVFDTCVTRCWHQPTDLFEALFLALLAENKLPLQQRETAAKALARSRIQAERTARSQTSADDITLNEIYQTLAPQLKAYDIAPDQALTEEIALELASVSPILSTRRYIQQLREQGHQVLFISDMYLPTTVVRQMLMDQGFTDGSDEVFVSADVGLSKGSGKLFSTVCKQLNIAPSQLHHTGDNRYADVRSARRMGVKATYFTQGAPTRYEQGFRSELIGPDWVRSQIIGNSRAVRLRHAIVNKGQRQHAMLAANLLAPLLTGYVAWVLTTAQAMGIERLYFDDGDWGDGDCDDGGLLAIAQTIRQQWSRHWDKQNASGRSQISICDTWANAPIRPHPRHQANEPIEQETPWATVGLANFPMQTRHSTVTNHSPGTGYHFRLFSTHAQTQGNRAVPDNCQRHDLPYIEAPIKASKRPEGIAYLFKYRPLLHQLAATINSPTLPIYRVIVLDYATTLASSSLQPNNNTIALDMVKRYAISNIIHWFATPTRPEVQALIEIQQRISLPALTTDKKPTTKPIVKPILPKEVPVLIKQFIKGTDNKTTNHWVEGSLAVSSWPLQQIFHKVRSLYTAVVRYRTY